MFIVSRMTETTHNSAASALISPESGVSLYLMTLSDQSPSTVVRALFNTGSLD